MLKIEMGLTGITRKEVAGIISECVEFKPVYKGGLTYQFNIADGTVFMDSKVKPEKVDGEAGDDCKVGISIPDSPQQDLAEIFKALGEAKAIINNSCQLAISIEGTGHTDKSKEILLNLFESKKEIIFSKSGSLSLPDKG